ncbi:Glutamine synthetase cytosolic isozyme [Tetrabaena socialis]|uniref:glutamine synthetase n=1 Tax=Tetrabaena socialis TaxID=47790 RepID=A0A2J8A2X8_9CHLO|nr:Glutamine synthetase cytosolic isozyme [Tetrabaena socialis]|eukprot:PNH06848.1 Glutamine synthetase cytosolic isozyme [Tetrabaena socialis]
MDLSSLCLSTPNLSSDCHDGSNHSASDVYMLPAYLRAPEVTAQVMAEYIWLMGGAGQLRSKTKVLESKPSSPEEVPVMVVASDSSESSEPSYELFLKPRKIFRDPFRGGDHILVLCDTFCSALAAQVASEPSSAVAGPGATAVLQPAESNSRVACENVQKVVAHEEPVFAAEQEYAVVHPAYPTRVPLGPPRRSSSHTSSNSGSSNSRRAKSHVGGTVRGGTSKGGKGSSRCSPRASPMCEGAAAEAASSFHSETVAARHKSARTLADAHLRCCLYAGIKVTGADVHSLEGLHSYKVGPMQGVDLGDQLWTSRYLLQRVAMDHGTAVSWDPGALPQERPLACHFKFSTAATRRVPHGLGAIEQQLARLQATHVQHQVAYNDGRLERLAQPEASVFTHAVGSADVSVAVPSLTYLQQGGYYVDRRPPSDADPYKVTLLLAATTLDVPLPKLTAPPPAGGGCAGPAASACLAQPVTAAAALSALVYRPIDHNYLLAVQQQQQQQHRFVCDSEGEEYDSVDEDAMTEDSAALLAQMDDDAAQTTRPSCDEEYGDQQDDANSGPVAHWAEEEGGEEEGGAANGMAEGL